MGLQNNLNSHLLMLPGGISIPRVKYPRVNINNGSIGNNDIYTVPSGRRSMVLNSSYQSQSGSSATIVQNWKISGTYYTTTFSSISLSAGAYLGDTNDGGYIMEAGETLSFNSTQSAINFFTQIIEFDNTANVKTVKTIGSTNGDQTIYIVPSGKKAVIVTGNGRNIGNGNQSFLVSNNSGGSIASNIYLVPNGSSKGANNLCRGSLSTSSGLASRIVSGAVLSAGDFVVWNCNTTSANALCALTVLEI